MTTLCLRMAQPARMAWLLVAALALAGVAGCGGGDDSADASPASDSSADLPAFLQGGPQSRPPTDDSARAHPGEAGRESSEPSPSEGDNATASEPAAGSTEAAEPREDDGWSAVVTDFPEAPPALDGGGTATPTAAAERYLTFLCTGDLDLYVSVEHPERLSRLDETVLRTMREDLLEIGFPLRFETLGATEVESRDGQRRWAAVTFVMHFTETITRRDTLWVENLGTAEQPRWYRSIERPSREMLAERPQDSEE